MSDVLTQTLVFDVQMGAIRGSAQARNAIESLASSAMGAGTIKGIRSSTRQLEGDMKRVMAAAFKSGMGSQGRELYKMFRQSGDAIIKAREQVARIDNQLLIATDRSHRQRLMRNREELRREIETRQTATKNQIDLLDAQASRAADMLETASRNASRNWQQSVEKSGKAFSDIVDKALNLDSLDPSQMVKGFGEKFKNDLAPRLTKYGAKNAGKGGMLGGLGRVAATLGKLGPVIAAAAASIGALVAVFMAAYAQTKKLNSAILEGQAAADMFDVMADRGRGLGNRLEVLRDEALKTAYAFRMSGEEVSQMMAQINEAGLQINEWKDYTGNAARTMNEFALVTHQAFVASKAFGVSVSEISGFTATMFHEMGKGLERVDEGFRMIFAGAQRSSMSTKQFFTSITEATSGMALYNFRLDDTVGLLLQMTEVLGEDLAASQSRMAGAYRNMGMEQRLQTVMNAGGSKVSARIMTADFAAQADEFASSFGEAISESTGLQNALGAVFVDGQLDRNALGTMGEEDFRALIYEIRHTQGNAAMAMQLENIVGLARGSQGGLTNVATNLGSLSRQGELMQQLMEGRTLLGNAGVSSFEGLNRQAYENITGRSGEDFEILQRLDRDLRGRYDAYVKDLAPGQQAQSFEEFGIQALGADPALQEAAFQAMPVMERIAREHMMETRSIAQTLQNVIARALDGIWGLVQGIWSRMWGTSARDDTLTDLEDEIERRYDAIGEAQERIATASETLNDPNSTMEQLARARRDKERAEGEIAAAQADIQNYQRQYREVAAGGGDDIVEANALEQFRTNPDNHIGMTAPTMAPTESEQARVDAAPEITAGFMERLQALQARQEAAGITRGVHQTWTTEEGFVNWLNQHQNDLALASVMPRDNAGNPLHYGTGADTQWQYFKTGGQTSWGTDVTIGSYPSGVHSEQLYMADSQQAREYGHPGGTGYLLRARGVGDLTPAQQDAILNYLAGGDELNPTSAPGAAHSNFGPGGELAYMNQFPEEYIGGPYEHLLNPLDPAVRDAQPYRQFGQPLPPSIMTDLNPETNGGFSPEQLDSVMTWVDSYMAGDMDVQGIDDLINENGDINDTLADQLGVEEDSRDSLRDILRKMQESNLSHADMQSLSGFNDTTYLNKLTSGNAGIDQLIDSIRRGGRGSPEQRLNAIAQLEGMKTEEDFVWRPGSGVRKISANDTLIGLKGRGLRNLGGGLGGGGINININGGDQAVVYQTVKRALKNSGMA